MDERGTKTVRRRADGRRARTIGWAVALTIVAFGLLFAARPGPPRSDEQQIREALTAGAAAVQNHDIPAIMQLVSKNYSDEEGMSRDKIRFFLAQVFRDHERIWVDLGNPAIRLDGEVATVTSDATVEVFDKGMPESDRTTHQITLRFRKEPGRRFLLFPDERWRVIEAKGAGLIDEGGLSDF